MDNPIFKQIEDTIFIPKKKGPNILGPLLLILVIGIIGFIALFSFTSKNISSNPQEVKTTQTVQQEITDKGSISKNLPFPLLNKNEINGKKVKLITSSGDITFNLSSDAPIASSNFVYLANKKFYDGVIFHRVIKGFMIQGGDPGGTGTGGAGYTFEDELNPATVSYKKGYVRGTVAMANAGPNTNSSQFFIMHQDYQLPHTYTIFGQVISGMDIVDLISNSQVDDKDKPIQPITIRKVVIE